MKSDHHPHERHEVMSAPNCEPHGLSEPCELCSCDRSYAEGYAAGLEAAAKTCDGESDVSDGTASAALRRASDRIRALIPTAAAQPTTPPSDIPDDVRALLGPKGYVRLFRAMDGDCWEVEWWRQGRRGTNGGVVSSIEDTLAAVWDAIRAREAGR